MKYDLLHRPRATVRIAVGNHSLIGKTKHGRVGLVSKRYAGADLKNGEVWLVDVVQDYDNFFIMIPIEKLKDATETTENRPVAD
jgi:hypothetical protein